MPYGVKYKERLIQTHDEDLVLSGERSLTRKLVIGKKIRDVTFRALEERDKLCEVRDLLNDRYGWRGYGSDHNIPSGACHTTFTAEVDDRIVATVTLTIDSELGLNLDHTFGDELEQIRRMEGASICELTRLAFDSCARSQEVMAGLFHFAFIYGTMIAECTDLLIEVGLRHACYYEKMLGFERIGAAKMNSSVGVPAQLMGVKVEAIGRSIGTLGGSVTPPSRRSLYYNFFPPLQEAQIRCLLSYSSTQNYVLHDGRYFGSSYSESTGESANTTGSKDSFEVAAIIAARERDVTASSDVCKAA